MKPRLRRRRKKGGGHANRGPHSLLLFSAGSVPLSGSINLQAGDEIIEPANGLMHVSCAAGKG